MNLTPAMADLYSDDHEFIIIQKGSQVGISEYMLSDAMYTADRGLGERGNSLYLMPTDRLINDFVSARLDPAIEESNYLRSRVRGTNRTGLKLLGDGTIYLRSSESLRQLLSVDADAIFLDEFDYMGEGVLPLALQRLGSSSLRKVRIASTPRYPEAGINALFLQSDQRHYYLPCPRCQTKQVLSWPENVDQDRAMIVCVQPSCRSKMDLYAPGEWLPSHPSNDRIHGYHLPRLYSPLANVTMMQQEFTSDMLLDRQQFFNQVLGEVFVPPGGGLTIDDLDRSRGDYSTDGYSGQPCLLGVDVGTRLHVIARESKRGQAGELWYAGEAEGFEELPALMSSYNVQRCVVDGQPEAHAAGEFARSFPSRVWIADYNRHLPGHEPLTSNHRQPNLIHINRTEALDEMTSRMKDGKLPLPGNARTLGGRISSGMGEYYREMTVLHRTIEQSNGDWRGRWLGGNRPDHFAHAEVYCMVAEGLSSSGRLLRWSVW